LARSGFKACDTDRTKIVEKCQNAPDLAGAVDGARVMVSKDRQERPRIIFNLSEVLLRPGAGIVAMVSTPANHTRQVAGLLEASKDLRSQWDAVARGAGLSWGWPALIDH
jgi:hypothetical protein